MIYETDTDMVALWNGSSWRYIAATTATSGSVLQVQSTGNNTQTVVASSTYTTLTNLSVSITPKSTSSKVLVTANIPVYTTTSTGTGNAGAGVRLLRNGSTIFDPNPADGGGPYGMYSASGGNLATIFSLQYLDSPTTTSALTYSLQGRGYNASMTVYFNPAGGVQNGTSVITAMEIAG